MRTMLFNPYSGQPRHPCDVASDPFGRLMIDPNEPMLAAATSSAPDDTRRLDWLLPIVTGDSSQIANRRTIALSMMIMVGIVGREGIDAAMKIDANKPEMAQDAREV